MDQYARLLKLITEEELNTIKGKKVLIIGLGGVGGYALEALTRIGIGSFILVDYDTVDISNLNRQILTNHHNIGQLKVDIAEERIKSINPNCIVKKLPIKILKDNINILFEKEVDYIVDACDTTTTKILIMKETVKRKIPLISVLGTGNKWDPSKLQIIDIKKTTYDPLAALIRKELRNSNINDSIMVVASNEKIETKDGYTPGSNPIIPSIAGLMAASYIINLILKRY